jgi:MOSC domain-containing protein YiiM
MKRGPMDFVEKAVLVNGVGLKENADQGGRRQVTILEQEVWDSLMKQVHETIPPSARRANLLVSRISLARSRKRILLIGDCRIRILGETKPCERMEELYVGLQKVMSKGWAGGVFGEVLEGGEITVGDFVTWSDEEGDLLDEKGNGKK